MTNSIIIISGIGIIQSLLFSFLILLKNDKKLPDWILMNWFLVYIVHLTQILAMDQGAIAPTHVLAKTLGLLHGPMLLLYARSVFDLKLTKKELLHFAPFFFFISGDLIIADSLGVWDILIALTKILSFVAYPMYLHFWHRNKLALLKTMRADDFVLSSQWVITLANIMLIFAGAGVLHVLADVLLGIRFSGILDLLFYVLMITISGFYGLRFRMVYDSNLPEHTTDQQSKSMYSNSPLNQEEIAVIRTKIDAYFEETDAYLKPDFSLTNLSEQLDIPKHHLSEVINLDMGSSFYQMVNARRVQYAMRRLKTGASDNITLEGLGYECGFNTKSAFFHHFKNFAGKTPGQYKSAIGPD